MRATMRGWDWAIKNPDQAIDEMLTMFPEMQNEREFHMASFQASIPLIIPPGKNLGNIDCEEWLSNIQMGDKPMLCTNAFIPSLRE